MDKLTTLLSNAVAKLDAIENRLQQKDNRILDQSATGSVLASGKTPKAGEVTLFGHFDWDPPVSGQQEIDALLAEQWSPSVLDFMAATGLSADFSIGSFEALLAAITDYKPDSISRLNFFTHANSVTLGMAGTIDTSNVHFDSYIDDTKMDFYSQSGLTIEDTHKGKKRTITLDNVRKRFKKDAIFVLYACHGGVNETLLKSLCMLLKVTIIGFKDEIVYCPPVQTTPPFKRKGMKVGIAKNPGGCTKNDTTKNWKALIEDSESIVTFKHEG